jgi:carboxy-terminal domain RNA polymerase II polypeptide A small phosphatase
VIDQLDPTGAIIKHRLYRDSCREMEPGRFVKDLSLTGRALDQVVIVDDNPNAYTLQPDNAIPVKPFMDNLWDVELRKVVRFLELAGLFEDVRDAVRCYLSDFGDDSGTLV